LYDHGLTDPFVSDQYQEGGKDDKNKGFKYFIGDGIVTLPNKVRGHADQEITYEGYPGTAGIAKMRDKKYIQNDGDQRTAGRYNHSKIGFIS
jgi:hypothetical protein